MTLHAETGTDASRPLHSTLKGVNLSSSTPLAAQALTLLRKQLKLLRRRLQEERGL